MPNAHTHLAAVLDLLDEAATGLAVPWLAGDAVHRLAGAEAAFLLGAISPDVRVVSGQPREATHFFAIPPENDVPAHQVMLAAWPVLDAPSALNLTRAAFVAGYISHLVMDQVWLEVIVMPGLFLEGHGWGTRHPNWRLYSILMTYMEYRAAARLRGGVADQLAGSRPAGGWLPFVRDRHLSEWRDHVVRMMRTQGQRRTSELFARTNGLTTAELEMIVLSEERMAAEAYGVIPPERLRRFEDESARLTRTAVLDYLSRVG